MFIFIYIYIYSSNMPYIIYASDMPRELECSAVQAVQSSQCIHCIISFFGIPLLQTIWLSLYCVFQKWVASFHIISKYSQRWSWCHWQVCFWWEPCPFFFSTSGNRSVCCCFLGGCGGGGGMWGERECVYLAAIGFSWLICELVAWWVILTEWKKKMKKKEKKRKNYQSVFNFA